jgi:phage FluMu protein gp41
MRVLAFHRSSPIWSTVTVTTPPGGIPGRDRGGACREPSCWLAPAAVDPVTSGSSGDIVTLADDTPGWGLLRRETSRAGNPSLDRRPVKPNQLANSAERDLSTLNQRAKVVHSDIQESGETVDGDPLERRDQARLGGDVLRVQHRGPL